RDDAAHSFFFSHATGAGGSTALVTETRTLAARAVAPAAALGTVAAVARTIPLVGAALHPGRRTLLQGIHTDGEVADGGFVDRHGALELLHGSRRRIDVHQGVVTLAVLLDPEREGPEAPVFLLLDGAALGGDQFSELVGQCLHLRRRHVLARDEDVLVQCHSG